MRGGGGNISRHFASQPVYIDSLLQIPGLGGDFRKQSPLRIEVASGSVCYLPACRSSEGSLEGGGGIVVVGSICQLDGYYICSLPRRPSFPLPPHSSPLLAAFSSNSGGPCFWRRRWLPRGVLEAAVGSPVHHARPVASLDEAWFATWSNQARHDTSPSPAPPPRIPHRQALTTGTHTPTRPHTHARTRTHTHTHTQRHTPDTQSHSQGGGSAALHRMSLARVAVGNDQHGEQTAGRMIHLPSLPFHPLSFLDMYRVYTLALHATTSCGATRPARANEGRLLIGPASCAVCQNDG